MLIILQCKWLSGHFALIHDDDDDDDVTFTHSQRSAPPLFPNFPSPKQNFR